jgi:Tfp pilus assembly protein PilN
MKKVNLITPLPPHKQYEIYRWFCMTIFLGVCALLVGSYFIVPQIITYTRLKKGIAGFSATAQEHGQITSDKQSLKKEYDELHVRESKINSYKKQNKNPHLHIAEIVRLSGHHAELESVKINKKEIEIEIVCATAEYAQTFITSLSSSPYFSHLKMVSLQQDTQNKKVRCAIKGNVIF